MKPGDNAKDDRALAAVVEELDELRGMEVAATYAQQVCDSLITERDAAIARAARAEAALVEAEAKRDKAAALAETYRRDWYDAKAEFQANCDNAVATERARLVEEIAALADERAAYHLDEAVADSAAHSGAHKALSNLAETIRRRNGARVVVPHAARIRHAASALRRAIRGAGP